MGEDIFDGLPPPSQTFQQPVPSETALEEGKAEREREQSSPRPVLKSALKRPKPAEPDKSPCPDGSSESSVLSVKKLKFRTMDDVTSKQVLEAMKKITSHISNAAKFPKASKLAIELVQAGSVKADNSDHFFTILEAAMSTASSCNAASLRSHYRALFLAATDVSECFNDKQKRQFEAWAIKAIVANDLFTDDSFLFSKTAGKIKDIIGNLPMATKDDDVAEARSLNEGPVPSNEELNDEAEAFKEESDPFGLDALISSKSRVDKLLKTKVKEEEENRDFLQSKREALINCIDIAARRYKIPWCQTVIDILVKHAFDNIARFTSKQREAIEKVWTSVREQQTRRKQGKPLNGKLDVTAFEWLQQKYSTEKISIRHSVGGSGDRRAQQWLG